MRRKGLSLILMEKNITRTAIPDARIGIHATMHNGGHLSNRELMPSISLWHAHVPNWEIADTHLDCRIPKGSCRKKYRESGQLNDVHFLIVEKEGDAGLHPFFDEMYMATPEHLDLLRGHDMLLTWRMDLDEKVSQHFGNLKDQT